MRRAITIAAALAVCACTDQPTSPVSLKPVVVRSPLHLGGALVNAAPANWFTANVPPRAGDPVPVRMTAYCLSRPTARRGRDVRAGIIAADARLFPHGRDVDLYADGRFLGRFLADDAGRKPKGDLVEIWMPTCREARQFGHRRGTAVLVATRPDTIPSPGSTAR